MVRMPASLRVLPEWKAVGPWVLPGVLLLVVVIGGLATVGRLLLHAGDEVPEGSGLVVVSD